MRFHSDWRAVEAQHKNATIALAHGSLADLLEDIIEEVEPPSHPGTAGLHYLIATPFRYRSPPPAGSRFRAVDDPPVFYGAEEEKTACAEAGYWRWRFWMDSEALRQRSASIPMALFRFYGGTQRCLDLTAPPLGENRDWWIHPSDYSRTQDLARTARSNGTSRCAILWMDGALPSSRPISFAPFPSPSATSSKAGVCSFSRPWSSGNEICTARVSNSIFEIAW